MAQRLLRPLDRLPAEEAILKGKQAWNETCDSRERQKDEFLSDAVTGQPVSKGDFLGLVSLASALSEQLQLAQMYGNANHFNEPKNMLAICDERTTFLHDKLLKLMGKLRQKGETPTFEHFMQFLKDEAKDLDRPEGPHEQALAAEIRVQLK